MRGDKLIDGVGVMAWRIMFGNIAGLLRNSLAHSDRNSLMLDMADLLGNFGTLCDRFTLADLIRKHRATMKLQTFCNGPGFTFVELGLAA